MVSSFQAFLIVSQQDLFAGLKRMHTFCSTVITSHCYSLCVSRVPDVSALACVAADDIVLQGLRKPAPAAFEAVTSHLQLPAQQLVFVDDRQPNVDAAAQAGMAAILFEGTEALEQRLQQLGLEF
jgi:histidinol phosphatase-like enzyme